MKKVTVAQILKIIDEAEGEFLMRGNERHGLIYYNGVMVGLMLARNKIKNRLGGV